MKKILLTFFLATLPCVASVAGEAEVPAAEDARTPAAIDAKQTHRERGDALRAQGLLEQANVEYRRALAERELLPRKSGDFAFRGQDPLSGALERHREAIRSRLSAVEAR